MNSFKKSPLRLLLLFLLTMQVCHGQNWTVSDNIDQQTGRRQCILQSRSLSLFDGYDRTNIQLKISQDRLLVKTDSNIDATGDTLKINIDNNKKQFTGSLSNKTDIVFEQNFEQLISQSIAGNELVISLQFWPTWPNTRVYQASFSLIGFTKALKGYHECLEKSVEPL